LTNTIENSVLVNETTAYHEITKGNLAPNTTFNLEIVGTDELGRGITSEDTFNITAPKGMSTYYGSL